MSHIGGFLPVSQYNYDESNKTDPLQAGPGARSSISATWDILYALQGFISSNQDLLFVDKVPTRPWNILVRLEKTEDMHMKLEVSVTNEQTGKGHKCADDVQSVVRKVLRAGKELLRCAYPQTLMLLSSP